MIRPDRTSGRTVGGDPPVRYCALSRSRFAAVEQQHLPAPPMTLGNMRELDVHPRWLLPARLVPAQRADRRVGLSGRDRGTVIPAARELQQVRWQAR
jgi:hypothetical protein